MQSPDCWDGFCPSRDDSFPVLSVPVLYAPGLNGSSRVKKLTGHTESTEQSGKLPGRDPGRLDTVESSAAGGTLAAQSGQSEPVIEVEREDLTSFFAVGVVINIVMITAYFVWAYRQWNKSGTSGE